MYAVKLTLFNEQAEEIDSCFLLMPDEVTMLELGNVVDEHTTVFGYDKVKIHVWDRSITFQTTVLSTIPSAVVVAALIVDRLRTMVSGSYRINWPAL